jgi:hypothetical protein
VLLMVQILGHYSLPHILRLRSKSIRVLGAIVDSELVKLPQDKHDKF